MVAAVDAACSRFRPDSEVTRLAAPPVPGREVSAVLASAVAAALRAARLTDGAVDPTLGHALVAAGYDRDIDRPARHGGRPGTARRGCRRRRDCGAGPGRTLRRRPSGGTCPRRGALGCCRSRTGVLLDLGATAKAFAADRAAARGVRRGRDAGAGQPRAATSPSPARPPGQPWLVLVVGAPGRD